MKYGKKILAVVLLLLSGTGMLTAAAGSRTGDAQVRTERDLQLQSVTMEELEEILNSKPGFVKAMWCGDQACEDTIKEKFAATSRCMPFEQEQISDTCVCCGKPAKKMVYWGRAY